MPCACTRRGRSNENRKLQELTRHDWQMTKTASAIGISRKKLWERLRRLGLTVPARASCPKFERQWR